MWIVGRPSNYLLTYGLENLERHFHVELYASDRTGLVGKIRRGLDARADGKAFR